MVLATGTVETALTVGTAWLTWFTWDTWGTVLTRDIPAGIPLANNDLKISTHGKLQENS